MGNLEEIFRNRFSFSFRIKEMAMKCCKKMEMLGLYWISIMLLTSTILITTPKLRMKVRLNARVEDCLVGRETLRMHQGATNRGTLYLLVLAALPIILVVFCMLNLTTSAASLRICSFNSLDTQNTSHSSLHLVSHATYSSLHSVSPLGRVSINISHVIIYREISII